MQITFDTDNGADTDSLATVMNKGLINFNVLITMANGETFKGLVVSATADEIVLREADADETLTDAEGQVIGRRTGGARYALTTGYVREVMYL